MPLHYVAWTVSRFAVLQLACLLLACRDEGEAAFARARAHYDALLDAAQLPDAKGFDDVIGELDLVPEGSKRRAEAQRLKQNIVNARVRVRAPLAIVKDERSFPPDVVAQLKACTRLAELAGADGGVTREHLAALDACRVRAEQLELEHSHGAHALDAPEPLDGGPR